MTEPEANALAADEEVKQLHLQVAPLNQLQQILPGLLQNLAIGRGQIAVDQLRSAIRENVDQIVLVTASHDGSPAGTTPEPTIVAAAIAMQPIDPSTGLRSESASLIHAALLQPIGDEPVESLWTQLSRLVDKELCDRGVDFVQWATAPLAALSSSQTTCCQQLGFEPIAELEYLSRTISDEHQPADDSLAEPLVFDPVDSTDEVALDLFAPLVHQTYTDTLDCPRIAKYRTARQALAGYQANQPIDSRLWFRVFDQNDKPVGCVILASHAAQRAPGELAKDDLAGGVMELVYMGLVPESRGRGIGRVLLCQTMKLARQRGADRLILAVDKKNKPARDIYHRAGFKAILDEAIWVRSLVR